MSEKVRSKQEFNKLLHEIIDWNQMNIAEDSSIIISPETIYFREVLSKDRQLEKNEYIRKIGAGEISLKEIRDSGKEIVEERLIVGRSSPVDLIEIN